MSVQTSSRAKCLWRLTLADLGRSEEYKTEVWRLSYSRVPRIRFRVLSKIYQPSAGLLHRGRLWDRSLSRETQGSNGDRGYHTITKVPFELIDIHFLSWGVRRPVTRRAWNNLPRGKVPNEFVLNPVSQFELTFIGINLLCSIFMFNDGEGDGVLLPHRELFVLPAWSSKSVWVPSRCEFLLLECANRYERVCLRFRFPMYPRCKSFKYDSRFVGGRARYVMVAQTVLQDAPRGPLTLIRAVTVNTRSIVIIKNQIG